MITIEAKSNDLRGLLDAHDEACRRGFAAGAGKWIIGVDAWPRLHIEVDPMGSTITAIPDVDTRIGDLLGRPLILSRKPEYCGKAILSLPDQPAK